MMIAIVWIEIIAMIFILLGSLNFTVHFVAWRKLEIRRYWCDIQGRVFIYIVLVLIIITVIVLMWQGVYSNFWTALRYGSFEVISIISSTGYGITDFSTWPLFLPVLILGSGLLSISSGRKLSWWWRRPFLKRRNWVVLVL